MTAFQNCIIHKISTSNWTELLFKIKKSNLHMRELGYRSQNYSLWNKGGNQLQSELHLKIMHHKAGKRF